MSMHKEVFNIVEFLKKSIRWSATGFALGLSGGIDSAVCAALAKRAIDELNAENKQVFTLDLIILPMNNSESDAIVAREVASTLGVEVREVDLSDTLSSFLSALHPTADGHTQPNPKCVGNLKARMRMSAIYYSANVNNLLVIGTDNASETYTGYFTKHGDGAADIFPISPYTKREVYEMGRFLGLPESVLSRAPSAGLWEGQTDEDEMGVPYDFIDNIIEGISNANLRRYSECQYSEYINRLSKLHRTTEHKRTPPLVFNRYPEVGKKTNINS